jgi:hypothetical protein
LDDCLGRVRLDDTFLELYARLSMPEHRVVREYYDDLFSGRLGFELVYERRHKPTLFVT